MKARHLGPLAACLVALVGCASGRAHLRDALSSQAPPAGRDLEAEYVVRCPDVLEARLSNHQEVMRFEVGPDGGIDLPRRLRVAGLSPPRIAALLAREWRVDSDAVRVRVAEYRSQQVYLVGEVAADRQVVAYRGPETVVELLQRVGLGANANLSDVTVVRGHVADGKPPEVFAVDLNAILLKRDQQTNVRLEPSDHVHVGQRRPSKIAESLNPILRPICETVFGVKKEATAGQSAGAGPP
jgi:protein involved in polysaccharide export with SLBB domain